jgi:subfamily B ATP-binding cassette protein MsbA
MTKLDNVATAELKRICKRLWREYTRKHLKTILITALLLVISAAATGAQPLLIQQAFEKIFKEKDTYYLVIVPLQIICIFTVQAITLYMSNFIMGRISNAMIADMRKDLFRQVMDNEVEFYSKNDSGTLISRIVSEIIHIAAAISNFFNAWCRQVITSVVLLGVMLHQSVSLTVVSLIAFAIAFIPLRRVTVRLKKLTRQLNDKNGLLNTRLIESFTGIRTVKAFRKEEFEVEKVSNYIDEIEHSSNRTNMISIIPPPLMQIVGGFSVAFVIWFGGHQIVQGHMTDTDLVAFITALMMFARPARSLSNSGGVMIKGLVGAERFFEIMDAKPKYISREHGETLNVKNAEIRFDHVDFSYPSGAEAIRDLSITMQAGKRTALVGHSGSGKSTILNLIMKFYEPTGGSITIDGQPLSTASINSVRSNIALVSQDIFIFDDTALNNIGYGKDGATEEEIIAAAKAAHCHEFISSLPNGYNTRLGFSGESLSGGQKQRIAIARAFLRNAPILLMDEATSALDPKTEAEVQASLTELSKGRTTIIIAHRLSTVINADLMILMADGQIAATGTHDELMHNLLYRSHFGI